MEGPRIPVDAIPLPGWSNLFSTLETTVPGWYVDVVLGDPRADVREVRRPESCRSGAVALVILSQDLKPGLPLPPEFVAALDWIVERYTGRVILISDRDHWWRPDRSDIAHVYFMRADKPWRSAGESWLPLGWSFRHDPRRDFSAKRTSFAVTPVSERTRFISFVGSDRTSEQRGSYIKSFLAAMPNLERHLQGRGSERICASICHELWADPKSIGTHRRHVNDSCFVFSPAGYSAETFRLYEALESGAIPVVVAGQDQLEIYLSRLGRSFPVLRDVLPCFDAWPDAQFYIEGYIGAEARLEAKQQTLLAAWEQCKAEIRADVGERLQGVLAAMS